MKKGFTFIEMLIVIAILSVLSGLIAYTATSIKKDSTEKLYNAKVEYILSGAKEWGNDNINQLSNTCTRILISRLIELGYIIGDSDQEMSDEKTIISNPITGDSMNNLEICLKYEKINNKLKVTAKLEGD